MIIIILSGNYGADLCKKDLMKNTHLLLLLTVTMVSLGSCQGGDRNHRDQAATTVADSTSDTTKRAQMYTSDVDLNGDEKAFILSVSDDALLEAEAGTLIVQKTKNPMVKSLAQQIIKAYTKANKDLTLIAKGKGLNVETVLSEEHLAQVKSLNTLSGTALDKSYISLVISTHSHDESLFGKAAIFRNKDLKIFALNFLPEIQKFHKAATNIAIKMNISKKGNGDDLPLSK
jgi:predicted outer membrane protein